MRLFDHKKQYACTEIFRLEELQKLAQQLEDEDADENVIGYQCDLKDMIRTLTGMINEAAEQINEFIANLEEQERRK